MNLQVSSNTSCPETCLFIGNPFSRRRESALAEAFPSKDTSSPVFLSQEEAEALIDLAVIEKKKARLKYPYYDDEHPKFNEEHELKFDDVQMGIYEKTIYYVESAFKKGSFDHLIKGK